MKKCFFLLLLLSMEAKAEVTSRFAGMTGFLSMGYLGVMSGDVDGEVAVGYTPSANIWTLTGRTYYNWTDNLYSNLGLSYHHHKYLNLFWSGPYPDGYYPSNALSVTTALGVKSDDGVFFEIVTSDWQVIQWWKGKDLVPAYSPVSLSLGARVEVE